MATDPLFRSEALLAQNRRLEGQVSIVQPLSANLLLLCLLLCVGTLLLFLHQAQFSRKETVVGYLKPSAGISRISTQRSGIIRQLYVRDGESVQAGQKLALLSTDEYLAAGQSLSLYFQSNIKLQLELNQQKQQQLQLSYQQQQQEFKAQLATTELQLKDNSRQQQLLEQRIQLQQQRLNLQQELTEQGHIPKLQFEQYQEQHLALQQQLAELQALAQNIVQQRIQWQSQADALPIELQQQTHQLRAEAMQLEQQKTEMLSRGETLLTAPVAGRVTNLMAHQGQQIQVQQPLMQLMPESAVLHALLLVPTRAFGFIQPGQKTWLRFDAFPYQRFGLYQGKVTQLSKAVLMAQDPDSPVQIHEPVYQVQIELNQQFIEAYGEQIPLQAGMLLSADIVLEQRSVLHWLLDPLLSLKGRL
jgi:membrane fusion protein